MENKPILVHVTASLSLGGAETVLYSLVQGLQQDYTQYVISLHDGPFKEKIQKVGVPVFIISGFALLRLWRVLRELNPAVMHSLLWSANALMRIYARQYNKKLICAIHSPFNANTGNRLLRTLFDRITAEWATRTVFVSPGLLKQAAIAASVPAHQRVIILNGISVDELHALAQKNIKTRGELGLNAEHFVIGTVGRLVPVKNQKLLIKLINDLRVTYPHVRLIIVGHGPLQYELERHIHEFNLQKYIIITRGSGYEYYQLFDCFVQPSFTEGLSMALLEALSFKLPVLISSVNGEHDVITHGENGFIFDPQSLNDLVKSIEQVMDNYELCVQMGECAYALVQKQYTTQVMVQAYRQLFDGINPPG